MNNDLFNKVKDTGRQVSNHIGKNIKEHTAIGQKYTKMNNDTSYDNVLDFAKELASIAKTARTTYSDWKGHNKATHTKQRMAFFSLLKSKKELCRQTFQKSLASK